MEKNKMAPSECESATDDLKLEVLGIAHNKNSVRVRAGRVQMTVGPCTVIIPRSFFKAAAEWYLEFQNND